MARIRRCDRCGYESREEGSTVERLAVVSGEGGNSARTTERALIQRDLCQDCRDDVLAICEEAFNEPCSTAKAEGGGNAGA